LRLAVVLCLLALAVEPAGAEALDERVRVVASRLMCPVCEGRTVAESTSQLAAQMRALIRERLARGDTEEEVVQYFVDRYGPSVLAAPPARGLGLVLWVVPALVVTAGAAYVLLRFCTSGPPAEDDAA
jgi:cytochrome c-type biogenesis protein CcmH